MKRKTLKERIELVCKVSWDSKPARLLENRWDVIEKSRAEGANIKAAVRKQLTAGLVAGGFIRPSKGKSACKSSGGR